MTFPHFTDLSDNILYIIPGIAVFLDYGARKGTFNLKTTPNTSFEGTSLVSRCCVGERDNDWHWHWLGFGFFVYRYCFGFGFGVGFGFGSDSGFGNNIVDVQPRQRGTPRLLVCAWRKETCLEKKRKECDE